MKAEPRKPDESPPPPDTLSSKTLNATVYRETVAVCLRCVSGIAPYTSATTVDTPLPRRGLRVIYGAERYMVLLRRWRRSKRLKGLVPLLIAHTHIRARSHTSNGQLAAPQGSPRIIVCVCVCVSHIMLDLALERARHERHQRAREHQRARTS